MASQNAPSQMFDGVLNAPLCKHQLTILTSEAVNYYHKSLDLGCCSSPKSASEHPTI